MQDSRSDTHAKVPVCLVHVWDEYLNSFKAITAYADFLAFATPSIEEASVREDFEAALSFLIQCQDASELPPDGECGNVNDDFNVSDLEDSLENYIDRRNPC